MPATNQRQLIAVDMLMKLGLASSGAIAVVANYAWESGDGGKLPTAFRTSHLDHGSNGLAQWRLGRLDNYMKFVAAKHPDLGDDFSPDGPLWPWFGRLDYQLEFTVHELDTEEYRSLYAKLRKGGDIAGLVADFCWQYERPNKRLAHLAERVGYGKAIASALMKTPIVPDVTTHIAAQAHAKDQVQAQSAGMASVGLAGVAGVAGYHVHLPWFLWIIVALSLVVFVVSVMALIKAHTDAMNVKATAPAVTPDAPPAIKVTSRPSTAPIDLTRSSRVAEERRLAAREPKTLAEQMKL